MISREEHAFIAYDEEFAPFLSAARRQGRTSCVLGNLPVLSPTELAAYDLIRIGKTTLRFIPLCGPDFAWSDEVTDA